MHDLLCEIRFEYPNWVEVLHHERRTAIALERRGLIEVNNWEARLITARSAPEAASAEGSNP